MWPGPQESRSSDPEENVVVCSADHYGLCERSKIEDSHLLYTYVCKYAQFTGYIIILSIRLSISQIDASLEFNFLKLPLSSSTCTVLFGRLHRPAKVSLFYKGLYRVISLLTLDSAPVFPALRPLHPQELLSGPRPRRLLTGALLGHQSQVRRGETQIKHKDCIHS